MKSGSLILAAAYCLVLAGGLLLLETAARQAHWPPAVTRRLAHVAAGLFALVMWQAFTPGIFLGCAGLLLLLIGWSYRRRLLTSVHNVSRHTYGELYLPAGIIASYLLVADQPNIFIPAVLVVTLADAAAGIVSDLRQQQRPSKLGSVAFWVVAAVILWHYTDPVTALTISFIVMVVEKISPYGSDNATIPLATVLLLSL